MITTTDQTTLEERFAMRAETFRNELTRIAAGAQLPTLDVFKLWMEYSDTCRAYDQSALLWEFQQWYAPILTPQGPGPKGDWK
jgi:hypothetical protein